MASTSCILLQNVQNVEFKLIWTLTFEISCKLYTIPLKYVSLWVARHIVRFIYLFILSLLLRQGLTLCQSCLRIHYAGQAGLLLSEAPDLEFTMQLRLGSYSVSPLT